jgi:hypothetical protein
MRGLGWSPAMTKSSTSSMQVALDTTSGSDRESSGGETSAIGVERPAEQAVSARVDQKRKVPAMIGPFRFTSKPAGRLLRL